MPRRKDNDLGEATESAFQTWKHKVVSKLSGIHHPTVREMIYKTLKPATSPPAVDVPPSSAQGQKVQCSENLQ